MNASDFPEAVPVVTTTFSPAPRRLPRLGLVPVQGRDAVRDERRGNARVEVVGKRLAPRGPRRLDPAVGDLLALEQIGPAGCDVGRHGPSVAGG